MSGARAILFCGTIAARAMRGPISHRTSAGLCCGPPSSVPSGRIDVKSLVQLALFVAAALLACAPTSAQPAADFYKGKTVTLVVSSSPGGGYDIMARTIAKYLGRHLPGNPRIVISNMPGAGGIVAM